MNKRILLWGGVVIAALILIGLWLWPKTELPVEVKPERQGATTATVMHQYVRHQIIPARSIAQPVEPTALTVTATNAAAVYRDAFELFNALSKEEQGILSDWRTNGDDAVTEKLCQKIRPICDLMHTAAAVSNCDWGLDQPLTFETHLPHLAPARAIGRAAVWSAAHCRANDPAGATDDLVADLQLGRQLSHDGLISLLVDHSIQNTALEYVAAHSDQYRGTPGERVLAVLDDPLDRTAWSHAMGQEVGLIKDLIGKLNALPADQAAQWLSKLFGGEPSAGAGRFGCGKGWIVRLGCAPGSSDWPAVYLSTGAGWF